MSGVLVPLLLAPLLAGELSTLFEVRSVVDRCIFVVSSEGGGGNDDSVGMPCSILALHRKHSPVP